MSSFTKKILSLVLGGAMLWLAACEKNPTDSKSQQPDLPPQSSIAVDLNMFNSANNLFSLDAAQTNAGLNFVAARLMVGAINLAVFAHMSVPVVTFAAAISQPPALKDDGKWHWIYS